MGIEDDVRKKLAPIAHYRSSANAVTKQLEQAIRALTAHVKKLEKRIESLERDAKGGR